MADFSLDSDALIAAKNGPYAFDIAPGFWEFLDDQVAKGTIRACTLVFEELVDNYSDELSDWVKARKATMFVEPDEATQDEFRVIADYVNENYESAFASIFLSGADPWVIAYALSQRAKVVSNETRVQVGAKRVKIPNVCDAFGVPVVTPYQMLRELGASFR